ncbi:PREDICTED: HAUS augmin-like complex subunit 4 [Dipodomys ordii]|uniref:HAUS augmin-like complex subunit 4 n=1 Tax=Dipodomys ordii TaxID=10020 RepID=A0A1S3FW46_DIPOR|nr:PREDICTED: HAUS augmin-like complex subunit 4 [Dipodomys ordii]
MASGDFCSPGEGMEILQQVCSKQLPPCNLSEEDLLQNPYFSKLLLSLSQHVDESGLSLKLAKEQAQVWKKVRLHKTTWLRSEVLQRVIQELLVEYYVKTQGTNLTEDKKFHETLEQRLLVTELTQLLGSSQEREKPSLLGLEKTDLLELMPPPEDFAWMRARLQMEVEEQLKRKCFTLLCYHDPNSDRLEGAIRLQEQDMEKSQQVLSTYEILGEEFDRLVKEYTQLKQAMENKRWALQEFNKACS